VALSYVSRSVPKTIGSPCGSPKVAPHRREYDRDRTVCSTACADVWYAMRVLGRPLPS
jgi:hypothetical protein